MCCFICEKRILAPKVVSSEALVRVVFVFDGKQKKSVLFYFLAFFCFGEEHFRRKKDSFMLKMLSRTRKKVGIFLHKEKMGIVLYEKRRFWNVFEDVHLHECFLFLKIVL